MHFIVVTLFPDMVAQVAKHGVVGRAAESGLMELGFENPREYADDVHRTVDDRPYGGGPGMVMKYEPAASALRAARARMPEGSPVVCLSPQGRTFDQSIARRYAELPGVILLAGRYEGIDERLIEQEVDEELSLGDFVLSGGEIAAMAVIDAVTRYIAWCAGRCGVGAAGLVSWMDCWTIRITRVLRVLRGRDEGARLCCSLATTREIARWRYETGFGPQFFAAARTWSGKVGSGAASNKRCWMSF